MILTLCGSSFNFNPFQESNSIAYFQMWNPGGCFFFYLCFLLFIFVAFQVYIVVNIIFENGYISIMFHFKFYQVFLEYQWQLAEHVCVWCISVWLFVWVDVWVYVPYRDLPCYLDWKSCFFIYKIEIIIFHCKFVASFEWYKACCVLGKIPGI